MIHKSLRHLRGRYGITPDSYIDLYEKQNGLCVGCGKPPKDGGRSNCNGRLFVDHDHKTGDIRGLLCQACNAAIGLACDDPNLLRKLADYLEKEPVFFLKDFPVKDRGSSQRLKKHCIHGHPFSDDNTYITKNNYRQCKTCRTVYDTKRRINLK